MAACASGILAPLRLPPDRNGTPNLLANFAAVNKTIAGSGVPNVGAPDCIEIEDAKLPNTTGVPGFIICAKAMPLIASASVCARTPIGVTGAIAPDRIKGVVITAWFERAYSLRAPNIVPSHVIGELALIKLIITVFSLTNSSPKIIFAISIVSFARSGAVTEPIKGLSDNLICV